MSNIFESDIIFDLIQRTAAKNMPKKNNQKKKQNAAAQAANSSDPDALKVTYGWITLKLIDFDLPY